MHEHDEEENMDFIV